MRDVYSTDGETFNFDSEEEAFYYAMEDRDPGDNSPVTIFCGEAVAYKASEFIPEMEEMMTEEAYERHGCNDCEFTITESKSLQEAVRKCVDDWCDKHKKHPTFYGVTNIGEMTK